MKKMDRAGKTTASVSGRKRANVRLVRRNCRLAKKDVETLRKAAEFQSDFYRDCFGARKIPVPRLTIYGRFDEFRYSQRSTPKYARSDFGFYSVDTREITIYKDPGYLETCFHEISHCMMGSLFRIVPEWLDEGMAQYFEGTAISENGVQITSHNWQLTRIRKLIRKNRVRLKKLLRLSYKKFHKRHDLDNYAVSWGILFMLMYIGRNFVKQIIHYLKSGKSSTESVDLVYPGGVLQLQKDFVVFYS